VTLTPVGQALPSHAETVVGELHDYATPPTPNHLARFVRLLKMCGRSSAVLRDPSYSRRAVQLTV
jgi:hypothetical protein